MAGKISFRIKGDRALIQKLRNIKRDTPDVMAAALHNEAEDIMGKSKEQYVPVDLGALRTSGHVNLPEIRGSQITVTLGYGGGAMAYALAVHEHPSEHDPPSWRGRNVHFTVGGPKYLERPMLEAANRLGYNLSVRAERMLRAQGM